MSPRKGEAFDDCYAQVANQLALSERDILAMINDVYRASTLLSHAMGQDQTSLMQSTEARYDSLAPFLKDLKKQLYDVQSLMNTYTKYSQFKPGLADSF